MLNLIIEPTDLASELDNENVLIVDLRAVESYTSGHIPNAINCLLSDIVVSDQPVGGLLPSEDTMSAVLSRLGYQAGKHIVIVDDNAGPQAGRFAWTLEAFGITGFSVLNGGMSAWNREIEATDTTIEFSEKSDFTACFVGENSLNRSEIQAQLNGELQIIDARTLGEYDGSDLRSARGGHIPGAIHFEWSQIKDSATMKFKPLNEIKALIEKAGIDPSKPCVAYCQTHMRSSALWLVLKALGFNQAKGYPGAWSDWGNQEDTPIA